MGMLIYNGKWLKDGLVAELIPFPLFLIYLVSPFKTNSRKNTCASLLPSLQ